MSTELQRVQRASAQLHRAHEAQVEAIKAAREAGCSLRQIAEAAGMSHEQVRRLSEETTRRES